MILFYLFSDKRLLSLKKHCGLIFSPESAIFLPFFHILLTRRYGKRDHRSIGKVFNIYSLLHLTFFFVITYYIIISLAI